MKKENKLQLKVQGIKGGNPTWKDNTGYIAAFVDNQENKIVIDNYTGSGDSYQRRENASITISKGEKNFTFNSFDSLYRVVEAYFKKLD